MSYRSAIRFHSSSILTVTGNSSVGFRILLSRIQDEMHRKAGQRNAKAKSMLSFLHDATGESGCSQTSSNRRRFRLTEACARMSFVHPPPPRSATSTFSISSLSLGQIPELDCTVLSLLCNAHGETNAFKCNSAFQVRRIQVLQRQQRGGMNHQIHQGLEIEMLVSNAHNARPTKTLPSLVRFFTPSYSSSSLCSNFSGYAMQYKCRKVREGRRVRRRRQKPFVSATPYRADATRGRDGLTSNESLSVPGASKGIGEDGLLHRTTSLSEALYPL